MAKGEPEETKTLTEVKRHHILVPMRAANVCTGTISGCSPSCKFSRPANAV